MLTDNLAFIAAPMVNQSDLPFRSLTRKYGATLAYTQMLMPDRILNDQHYFEHHVRDLTLDTERGAPVVVQLCGNDVDAIVAAGRKLQGHCDAIDLNLGCPLEAARDGRYGAYLLGQKDWSLVENVVSGMARSFTVPTSVKIRLCQPKLSTIDFAQRLEACGASWVTLHARTVSARRRRQGAAELPVVKAVKEALRVPVISNGNVRVWDDITANLELTGADGVMVGETLLGNPCLFSKTVPDPVDIALEYLGLCRQFPGTASLAVMHTHVRHFVEFQCARRPWFHKFRAALGSTSSTEEMETLLRTRVERWRGRRPRGRDVDGTESKLDGSVAKEEDSAATEEEFEEQPYDNDVVGTTLLLG